jgi:hypothetical protein
MRAFLLMAVGVAVVAGAAALLATSFLHQPAIYLYLAPATFIFGGMTAAARTGMISAGVFTGELITDGHLLAATALVVVGGVFAKFERYRPVMIGALGGALGRMLYTPPTGP